jgi:CheY-like chemotaxis protein
MPTIKTILLVDDDEDDLAMIHEALVEVGCKYSIAEVADGSQALNYLQTRKPDMLPALIVLDINMPRLDGKQTLIVMRENPAFASIPVVIFSTSSSEYDQAFAYRNNVELIVKPFDVATLHKIAARLLNYASAAN